MRTLRRMGIALGSLVAAWLCVSLVGDLPLSLAEANIIATVVVIVLSVLIYRDIVRGEASPS